MEIWQLPRNSYYIFLSSDPKHTKNNVTIIGLKYFY